MARSKVAISLDENTVDQIDRLVKEEVFPNRSQAIQVAIDEKLKRLKQSRLARECAKMDPAYEQALADEGIEEDFAEWPEY